jgi:hypothetical protein
MVIFFPGLGGEFRLLFGDELIRLGTSSKWGEILMVH